MRGQGGGHVERATEDRVEPPAGGGPGPEVVPAARLRAFAAAVFEAVGLNPEDAELVADVLVWADLRGISPLGVAKIPQYLGRIREGGTKAAAELAIVHEGVSFVVADARDTWGQVAGARMMHLAVAKARSTGVGIGLVRNTTSAGAMGYFATIAARAGFVGVAMNDSHPLQAPWGGVERLLGNQAFAIAAPTGGVPLVLDMATTGITLARIHELKDRGEPLPNGLALDGRGEPTTDPTEALTGILLPMGGHRGYGIAVMWEVLTGALSGGERFGPEVTGPDELSRPQGVSMLLMAIDPEIAQPREAFERRVTDLVERIQVSEPAPGIERVRVPGERSAALAAERERAGVPLPSALASRLREMGAELGVRLSL